MSHSLQFWNKFNLTAEDNESFIGFLMGPNVELAACQKCNLTSDKE